jgi:exopolyphosphatase/guanosine-5'-triphosphate,3'-diphosphate pyrophosphatase
MNKQVAIIDLGTNTCNLLIAEYRPETFKILYQGKEVVKLGKNAIDKNMLLEDGLERTVLAFKKHKEKIDQSGTTKIIALATSAIRDAKNRDWFQQKIEESTGIKLQVISGEEEADYIFCGTKLAFRNIEDHALILDIGGGSNEFILSNANNVAWKRSFPLGMARIIGQIRPSDPITREEIQKINSYFESRLDELWERTTNLSIPTLIGCSGAFDTLADLIDQTEPGTKTRIKQEISLNDFFRISERLIRSTIAEREKMKGMEPIRIEMIVPAVLFIKLILEKLKIQKMVQTDFALREGVLYQLIFS